MATADNDNHASTNGVQKDSAEDSSDIIDDDIQHTVDKLFHVRPHYSNHKKGHHADIEEIVRQALQAERNHWKSRLHTAMQEIDRQHKVILTAQSGLQEILRLLRPSLQRTVIMEDEEEEDMENTAVIRRLLENAKFQIRQLKLKAGMGTASRLDYEDTQNKQRNQISELKGKLKATQQEQSNLEQQMAQNTEKLQHLQKENNSLHKQLTKLQKIIQKYNENHSGANFHLNNVDVPNLTDKRLTDKRMSVATCDTTDITTHRSSLRKERTYVEGDQLVSYPLPIEENAIIKERLKKNIYSARKGDSRSSNVAQCLRCQSLFKPAENTHRSCRFHHKGREITEQFDDNGKLGKVTYKWACCKKPLETPGCCHGYHM